MISADLIQKLCSEAMVANASKEVTTKCRACRNPCTRTLQWLQQNKFKCPSCGGDLDDCPLHDITRSVLGLVKKSDRKKKAGPRKSKSTKIIGLSCNSGKVFLVTWIN